jgi:hypothetical protein
MYPLSDRGGLCVAQHGPFNWEKPGLRFFLNVPCIHVPPFARRVLGRMLRHCTASTPVSLSFEWHKSVVRLPSIYSKLISRANLLAPR